MTRILYAGMQVPWPPDNGGKIAALSDLARLSRRFEIDVVSYIDRANLPRKDEHLAAVRAALPEVRFLEPVPHHILRGQALTDRVFPLLRGLATLSPYVVSKYRSPSYLGLVRRQLTAEAYDVLAIESLAPSYVLSALPAPTRRRLKVVYRAFDVFAETLEGFAGELGARPVRLAAELDLAISRRYERRLWRAADAILTVTRRVGAVISRDLGADGDKVLHLPVLVPPILRRRPSRAATQRVLYVGTVHFPPNLSGLQWFLRQCWPLVVGRVPAATLDVVGRGGEALRPVPGSVRIHDYVDDLQPFYDAADVFVVPLLSGSGVRLKILESLNQGLPVVSTTAGYRGIDLEVGRDLLVADDAAGFADQVVRLLTSAEARTELAEHGRAFMATHHSPQLADEAVDRLLTIVQSPPTDARARA
jgi:glycosyltransferase involved in cell wall biosynthesis